MLDITNGTGLIRDIKENLETAIKDIKNDDKDLSKLKPDEMNERQKDIEINRLREENKQLKQENSKLEKENQVKEIKKE